uniref:SAICAR synthetase/ADE2 N-terminal domain-containing protein n=1 Tax=Timema bartmani TaxID=61472 RepID=A0A7R9I3D3_9NEOP|nr:unnamed protein product [Timema bartmani]
MGSQGLNSVEGHKLGALVIEGKTKRVFELPNLPGHVLLQSKDRITAGDGVKSHEMEGKAAISNQTTAKVFELLNSVVSTASCERGLSCHNRLKTAYRNSLKTETLDNLLRIPTALSIFFQEAAIPSCPQGAGPHFGQVCTPCNTPATPPNFPDALLAFSRMSTGEKLSTSPSGLFSSSPIQGHLPSLQQHTQASQQRSPQVAASQQSSGDLQR